MCKNSGYRGEHIMKPISKPKLDPEVTEADYTKNGLGVWLRFPYIYFGEMKNNVAHGKGEIWCKNTCNYGEELDMTVFHLSGNDIKKILSANPKLLKNDGYRCIHNGSWINGTCQESINGVSSYI